MARKHDASISGMERRIGWGIAPRPFSTRMYLADQDVCTTDKDCLKNCEDPHHSRTAAGAHMDLSACFKFLNDFTEKIRYILKGIN